MFIRFTLDRFHFKWNVIKYFPVVGFLLIIFSAHTALADIPLTSADIEAIFNRVDLIPTDGESRPANLSDVLDYGDAVKTAAESRVELRFNDGSLTRIGERSTFRFSPDVRHLLLSEGTALMFISEQGGPTEIETPVAVIRTYGQTFVVRHIASQDITLVLAMSDNSTEPMTVAYKDGGQPVKIAVGTPVIVTSTDITVSQADPENLPFDLGDFE